MKTNHLFWLIASFALLTSCAPSTYFQVYKVVPVEKMNTSEHAITYEDPNCILTYNFWCEGGDIGFNIYNKSDQNIYIKLDESFFIMNGLANDYYKNRVFTQSRSNSTTVSNTSSSSKSLTGTNYLDLLQTNKISGATSMGALTSNGYSISYNEEKVICIPEKSFKRITEYSINPTVYRNCDLFRYPTKKQIKTAKFSKDDTPFAFSNRIVYSIGTDKTPITIDNQFYVSEITNYFITMIIERRKNEFCGEQLMTINSYFTNATPDKFYIQYKKNTTVTAH
jgi:hypothetical protein